MKLGVIKNFQKEIYYIFIPGFYLSGHINWLLQLILPRQILVSSGPMMVEWKGTHPFSAPVLSPILFPPMVVGQ